MTLKSAVLGLVAALVLTCAPALVRTAEAQQPDERAKNFSLYWEAFRNQDYAFGMPYLRWLLANDPGFPNNNDRNYRKLLEAYQALGAKASDAAAQRAYLDSTIATFDLAVAQMRQAGIEFDEFDWTLQKGRFLQENAERVPGAQDQVFDIYMKAYRMQPDTIDEYYLNLLAAEHVRRATSNGMDKGVAIAFMDEIEPRLKTDEGRAYLNDQLRPMLFTTPREEFDWLYAKYQEGQRDEATTMQVFELARRLNEREIVRTLAGAVSKFNPSASLYRMLAQACMGEDDFTCAQEYFQKALDMSSDNTEKRDINYNLAAIMLQQGRAANAVTFAREALRFDANHGESFYIIGSALSRFAGGSSIESRAINWVAADHYNRAAQMASDASVRENARRAAAQSVAAGPRREDYFFSKNWQAGQSISVSTPVGSFTTTVR